MKFIKKTKNFKIENPLLLLLLLLLLLFVYF